MSDQDRSRSPVRHSGGMSGAGGMQQGMFPQRPAQGGMQFMPQAQFNPAAFAGKGGAGFSGVRPAGGAAFVGGGGGYGGGQAGGKGSNEPVDPLDAYMASVDRELSRTAKKDKKGRREKIGDVASAREAFGPRALEMLQTGPGGKGGEANTDSLLEDRTMR
mmetsp:Transcript_59525/g.166236  ORF Transcript_59525/g.166236 Transcript_59525/m.166236 type:complete len:161 (-) Transcript_59525:163-645(-)